MFNCKVYMLIADWFPWCGLLFNMKTLDVAVDYSRYRGTCKLCIV